VEFYRDLLAVSGAQAPAGAVPFGGAAASATLPWGRLWLGGGLNPGASDRDRVVALALGPRDHDFGTVDAATLRKWLHSGTELARLAAPFAGAAHDDAEFVLATDHSGLRHLYGIRGDGWAAVSTSAVELARLVGAPFDRNAMGTFAVTGFHLGETTPFRGVRKIRPGTVWHLSNGELTDAPYGDADHAEVPGGSRIEAMAGLLRGLVERCLDENPDTVFELSGGFDSRLLFAALPAARRAGVRTLTLSAPGRADAPIAGALAAEFRTDHQVIDLTGLAALGPEAAHDLVMSAARRHDILGNPVALGVLDWVESQVPPGVRITGQGGEMARGSYHMGQAQHPTANDELIDRLARWWFITNDATDAACLQPDFAESARADATAAIRAAFAEYDTDWLTAIDEFFLRERVHRWVGINFTGACLSRTIVAPYLDPRFLAIARAVPPTERSGSGFAARVLERLDPWLANARLATGVRPKHLPRKYVPRALAEYSVLKYAKRGAEKVYQFARGQAATAAGTPVLAGLVVDHWRAHPDLVQPVLRSGLIREDWLIGLLEGVHGTDAATVGFLANLVVAEREGIADTP
jgi:asparagine synthase (glutamine-hydrolysing)